MYWGTTAPSPKKSPPLSDPCGNWTFHDVDRPSWPLPGILITRSRSVKLMTPSNAGGWSRKPQGGDISPAYLLWRDTERILPGTARQHPLPPTQPHGRRTPFGEGRLCGLRRGRQGERCEKGVWFSVEHGRLGAGRSGGPSSHKLGL